MNKTVIKFAIRNLLKNKLTTMFNVFGMTLATLSLLFIFFYLKHELSFDRFHDDYQHIYNVYFDEYGEGVRDQYIQAPMGLGTGLLEDYPEIETMSRTYGVPNSIVKSELGTEYKDDVIWADAAFFELFSVELLSNSTSNLLLSPNQICISEDCAKKYFADKNPIGKILTIEGNQYEIKSVFKNYPENSHLTFGLIASLLTITKNRDVNDWDGYMYSTYIKLRKNTDAKSFQNKLSLLITNRLAPYVEKHFQLNIEEWFSRGNSIKLKLMPLSKIHLYASGISGFENQNNISNVILLIAVSLLVLFIACFNFINFNIGVFHKNNKTIGVKKICGSKNIVIAYQAFIEGLIVFLFSATLAVIVIFSAYTSINSLLNQAIVKPIFIKDALVFICILGCSVAFVCGYLPSAKHIQKNPSFLIKNNLKSKGSFSANNILVGLQFMITIVILTFSFVINNQVKLITNSDLGFDKENILIVHGTNRDRNKAMVFADELRKTDGITAVSVSNAYPGNSLPTKDLQLSNSPDGFSYSPQYFCCDAEMINVLNFELVKGEFFSQNSPDNAILLNETALKTYNIADNPIGQSFIRSSGDEYTVIGVVKDFNFKSLRKNIEPLCIYTGTDYSNSLGKSKVLVKLANYNNQIIRQIKDQWKSLYGDAYFDFSFLADETNALYTKELLLRKTVPFFSLLALLISAIGLTGITLVRMNARIKEIGIRKVNGAKISEILSMLNRDFIKWVIIAFVIATPTAYFAMNKWLESFAYKTSLSWWIFALSGLLALGIALLTVSWQSWRAATRNPVEALRYE